MVPDVTSLQELLTDLHPMHAAVLRWFAEHEGDVGPRPSVHEGVRLLDPVSGIWKPAYTEYAVAIAQGVKNRYPDEPPVHWGDGTWTYLYHQEGYDLKNRDALATNRGLVKCKADGLPVGVVIPAGESRKPIYRVMGLAEVVDWKRGHFVLAGPVRLDDGIARTATDQLLLPGVVSSSNLVAREFRPDELADDRRKIIASVVRRQGQPGFRRLLFEAYDGKCAITGYDAPDALEAAHILAYRGTDSHHPANGLLLRADIHNLFDVGLLAVDTSHMQVIAAEAIVGTRYERFVGTQLASASRVELEPSAEALDRHRHLAGL